MRVQGNFVLKIIPSEDPSVTPDVVWDVSQIASAVERLKETQSIPNYFKVVGRNTYEYLAPLKIALDKYQPTIITSKANFRAAVGAHIVHRDAHEFVSRLFDRISDWGLDRLNVSVQNGQLWSMNESQLANNVLKHEPNSTGQEHYLSQLVDAVAEAFRDKVVILHGSCYHEPNYFKALLPLIVQRATSSVWVLFDDRQNFLKFPMPSIRREYVNYAEIVRIVAYQYNTSSDAIQRLSRSNTASSGGPDGFTQVEFDQEYQFLAKAASSRDLESLPDVPEAMPSPIRFGIRSDLLYVDLENISEIDAPVLTAVTTELGNMISDITDFHSLSNSAPVTARKLDRIKDNLVSLATDCPLDGTVIQLGIMVGALEESIRFDPEGLIENARGPLQSLVTQSHLFLNRFEAWRRYLRDASKMDILESDESATRRVIEIMKVATDQSDAIHDTSRPPVRRFIAQIEQLDTSSEKIGLFAVLQNLLSTSGAFIKRQLVLTSSEMISDYRKDSGKWAVLKFVMATEFGMRALADQLPHMFGWLNGFLDWVKSVVTT